MASTLERLTNVAIIVACVAVTGALGARFMGFGASQPTRAPAYRTGDAVPTVTGVDYRQADKTLLIVVSSSCRFCTESMPFYRKLADEAKARGSRVQLAVAGTEDVQTVKTYLTKYSLGIDRVVQLEPGTIKYGGTPTLLLIDKGGKVRGLWEGRIAEAREQEVISAITS
jgi:hypothetical protein